MIPILIAIFILPVAEFSSNEADTSYQNTIMVLPFVSYTPETSVMFGLMAVYQFKPGRAGDNTRASNIIFSGTYTLNRQLMIELTPNVVLENEALILEGRYEYSFFPDTYWGVGADSPDDAGTDIEYRQFDFQQEFLFKISDYFHAGPKLRLSRLHDISFPESSIQPAGGSTITETPEHSTLPGIGFSLRSDRRNSLITPTKNHYLELTGMMYPSFAGNTHPHTTWLLDIRRYLDLLEDGKSVLALHLRNRYTTGNPPFQEYALLGGREIMRGYYEGRFRDHNAAQLQAEFRQHLAGRFGATIFAAAGEVWGRFDELSFSNPKFSAGAGLRFNLNPKDTTNLRIDFGTGRHGSGLYITIGEAF